MMLLAFSNGLCIDNDLMLAIHRGDAVESLNGSLAGFHLARLVVGDVAFDSLALLP